jgi:protein SCO1
MRAVIFALCLAIMGATRALPARADGKPLAARVGVDEQVGALVPSELIVTDQRAQRRRFGDFLQSGRPLLLALAYYHCPGLCDVSLRELATTLRGLGWQLGSDYDAVSVSIDPHDTPPAAAAKRANVVGLMHVAGDTLWPFTVASAQSLQRLTQTLGYRYDYDAATHQYAHPAVSIVLTPQGKIARYLYGPTLDAQSVRLALREARLGRGGASALIDRTILACYQYDPQTRRYSLLILTVMRGGAAVIALLLAVFVLTFARRGRLRRAAS